jgi:hypothetical protein
MILDTDRIATCYQPCTFNKQASKQAQQAARSSKARQASQPQEQSTVK